MPAIIQDAQTGRWGDFPFAAFGPPEFWLHSRSERVRHRDGNRSQTVGSAGGVAVLFIVHTEPGEDAPGRIISVRRATRHERKAYEEGSF